VKISGKFIFAFREKNLTKMNAKNKNCKKMNMVNVFTISPLLTDFFKIQVCKQQLPCQLNLHQTLFPPPPPSAELNGTGHQSVLENS
jgi:hypothetical protein